MREPWNWWNIFTHSSVMSVIADEFALNDFEKTFVNGF